MATPRFVHLYQSLPPDMQARFLLFTESPYFNTRSKLSSLSRYIHQLVVDEIEWNAPKAASLIFNDPGALKPLNNLLSDLNRLAEQFLATETVIHQPDMMESALAKALAAIPAPAATQAFLRRTQRLGVQDPLSLHYINLLADQFHFQQTREHSNEELLESQHHLTVYYLTTQLKTWCELLNRSHILALTYQEASLQMFKQILQFAAPELQQYPLARLYMAIFSWMESPSDNNWYFLLKTDLFVLLKQIDLEEAREVCAYLQNFCVKRINEGEEIFLQELFELFQYMIREGLVLEGNTISQWTYKNIVTVGLRLKAFAETEDFLHAWYSKLPEKDRDNAYNYNLAALHYESHDYSKATRLLSRVHFTDPVYYLDGHTILLKIYFEEAAEDALISLNETVRIYLLRQKVLNKNQIQLYKNLFRYTLKLFRLRYFCAHLSAREQYLQWNKVVAEINQMPQVANRPWLLQQADLTRFYMKPAPTDPEE